MISPYPPFPDGVHDKNVFIPSNHAINIDAVHFKGSNDGVCVSHRSCHCSHPGWAGGQSRVPESVFIPCFVENKEGTVITFSVMASKGTARVCGLLYP